MDWTNKKNTMDPPTCWFAQVDQLSELKKEAEEVEAELEGCGMFFFQRSLTLDIQSYTLED